MKIWVETRCIEPPDYVVSGRFGATVMFVAFDSMLKRWIWVQGNGVNEKIAEPPAIFVEKDYVNKHTRSSARARSDEDGRIRRKRSAQLLFEL